MAQKNPMVGWRFQDVRKYSSIKIIMRLNSAFRIEKLSFFYGDDLLSAKRNNMM